jgi:diaminopimelate decarboxylase
MFLSYIEKMSMIPHIPESLYRSFRHMYQHDTLVYPALYYDGTLVENAMKTWFSTMPEKWIPSYCIRANSFPLLLQTWCRSSPTTMCTISSPRELDQWLTIMNTSKNDSTSVEETKFTQRMFLDNPMIAPHHMKYCLEKGLSYATVDCIEQCRLWEYMLETNEREEPLHIYILLEKTSKTSSIGANADQVREMVQWCSKDAKHLQLHGLSILLSEEGKDEEEEKHWKPILKGWNTYFEEQLIPIQMIHIRGGISPNIPCSVYRDSFMQWIEPSIKCVWSLDTFVSDPAFHLITRVQMVKWKNNQQHVYVEDGMHGYLRTQEGMKYYPLPFYEKEAKDVTFYPTVIHGPSMDEEDCIIDSLDFPEMHIGDPIWIPNMGAYSISKATDYGGLRPSPLYPTNINLLSSDSDTLDSE